MAHATVEPQAAPETGSPRHCSTVSARLRRFGPPLVTPPTATARRRGRLHPARLEVAPHAFRSARTSAAF